MTELTKNVELLIDSIVNSSNCTCDISNKLVELVRLSYKCYIDMGEHLRFDSRNAEHNRNIIELFKDDF